MVYYYESVGGCVVSVPAVVWVCWLVCDVWQEMVVRRCSLRSLVVVTVSAQLSPAIHRSLSSTVHRCQPSGLHKTSGHLWGFLLVRDTVLGFYVSLFHVLLNKFLGLRLLPIILGNVITTPMLWVSVYQLINCQASSGRIPDRFCLQFLLTVGIVHTKNLQLVFHVSVMMSVCPASKGEQAISGAVPLYCDMLAWRAVPVQRAEVAHLI